MVLKKVNLIIASITLIFLLGVSVSAFGVSMTSSTFELGPGESIDTIFILDNFGEDASDVTVEIVVEEGSEYITLAGDASFSLAKEGSAEVPVSISVPAEASVGDSYNAEILFRPTSGGEEGAGGEGTTIGFVMSQRKSIDIVVVAAAGETTGDGTPPEGSNLWLWIIGIIVLIIIIWLVLRKKK